MGDTEPPKEAWSSWGGDGPRVVFAHANGFPPATYRAFLEELNRRFEIAAFAARPLWPGSDPAEITSWHDLADDFVQAMDERRLTQVVGVGHSLGGVLSILAAAGDPALFRALALVDPVVFTGFHSLFWGSLKGLRVGHRLPLIRGARRRREHFPDLDSVYASYAEKSVFSSWEPRVIEDYVRAGFREIDGGGVTLRYTKAWEARIFELTPASVWSELRRLPMPMLFIRGASSDTFLPGAADRARRELANATVLELEGTSHFLPMESPTRVASTIIDWFQSVDEGP
jgi:pimeloyl-ACP methyl ester carboxylesterase